MKKDKSHDMAKEHDKITETMISMFFVVSVFVIKKS